MLQLLVLLVAGRAGEALLAGAAHQGPLLVVRLHVALQVSYQAEGLPTLRAAVALHLGVDLEREGVRERLQAQGAVVEVFRVGFFVVEEGASMAVRTPTQVTPAIETNSFRASP